MEFEIQDGALRLRRGVWVQDHGEDWLARYAVAGLAGAVSLMLRTGHQRIERGEFAMHTIRDTIGASLIAEGIVVHAYRPIPNVPLSASTQYSDDNPMLFGGKGYSFQLDSPGCMDSTALLLMMMKPGGIAHMWDALEALYRQEFVPAETPEQIAARERELGAVIAEARLQGAPSDAVEPGVEVVETATATVYDDCPACSKRIILDETIAFSTELDAWVHKGCHPFFANDDAATDGTLR